MVILGANGEDINLKCSNVQAQLDGIRLLVTKFKKSREEKALGLRMHP